MTLYQEIIWLQTFFQGKWVIENVKPYYKPLIPPTFTLERHCYWSSNFIMDCGNTDDAYTEIRDDIHAMEKEYGYDLSKYRGTTDIRKALRNAVKPEDGKYILEQITKD